jgi:biotin carboxyl carrier protein
MKVNLTIEGKNYQVSIADINARPVIAEVNGVSYEVWPEEAGAPVAQVQPVPVVTAPATAPTPVAARPVTTGAQTINAPLPGVIISIEVKEGQSVKAGQELYVLEAMKMKNSIKADRDCKIVAIHVSPSDLVKHSQAIMSLEG